MEQKSVKPKETQQLSCAGILEKVLPHQPLPPTFLVLTAQDTSVHRLVSLAFSAFTYTFLNYKVYQMVLINYDGQRRRFCHPQTDCFFVSQRISVASYAKFFKLGSKPDGLYVSWISNRRAIRRLNVKSATKTVHLRRSSLRHLEMNSLFVWILQHINIYRLFNIKYSFIQINSFISNNSF